MKNQKRRLYIRDLRSQFCSVAHLHSPRQMRLRESGSRRRRKRKVALARCDAGAVACCRGCLARSLSRSLPRQSIRRSLALSLALSIAQSLALSFSRSIPPTLPSLPRLRAWSIPRSLSPAGSIALPAQAKVGARSARRRRACVLQGVASAPGARRAVHTEAGEQLKLVSFHWEIIQGIF
jgi:hypothetical protein